jgi:putative nucleotidyltransferase with HDIG domain
LRLQRGPRDERIMIRIAIIEGGGETRSHLLDRASIQLGRDAGNDIVLRDGFVSGRHGRIREVDGRVVYEDLRTTNGSVLKRGERLVTIDDRTLYEVTIEDGDELLLGDPSRPVALRLSLLPDAAPSPRVDDSTLFGSLGNLDVTRAGTVHQLSAGFDREALLALHALTTSMAGRLELDGLLEGFTEALLGLFRRANHVAVHLLDEASGEFRLARSRSRDGEGDERPLSRTVRDQVLACGRALTFTDTDEEFDCSVSLNECNVRAGLAAPLWNGRRILGLVQLDRRGTSLGAFERRDLEVLVVFAHQAALAIDNARLHRGLQETVEKSIQGLVRALDAKDHYTVGHSEAVAELCRLVAREAGLPGEQVETIARAAVLHDIGKVGIPYEVLNKQGRLSPEEFSLLRSHPEMGARILEPFEFLAELIPIVLHHHERWDGKGYPQGLAGEEIPYGARILAVVDTYHSLVSDRAYRPGVGAGVAVEELQRCAGSQFDPELVELTVRALAVAGLHEPEAERDEESETEPATTAGVSR